VSRSSEDKAGWLKTCGRQVELKTELIDEINRTTRASMSQLPARWTSFDRAERQTQETEALRRELEERSGKTKRSGRRAPGRRTTQPQMDTLRAEASANAEHRTACAAVPGGERPRAAA